MHCNLMLFSFSQSDDEDIEELGIEEDVIDISDNEGEDVEAEPLLEGFPKVQASAENIREAKFVVTKGCLDTLVDMIPLKKCKKCGNTPEKRIKTMGCTVEYKWVCFTKYL